MNSITIAKRMVVVFVMLPLLFIQQSCKKYLDVKPIKERVTPNTLDDLQAILDYANSINQSSPRELDAVADDYYLTTSSWNLWYSFGADFTDDALNYYWDNNAKSNICWNIPYQKSIYPANVVLDQIKEVLVQKNEQNKFNSIKGSALFYRAFAFHQLAQLYCRPYTSTAATDLGIVLRLTSDISQPSTRSTVQQTYDQIINDLKEAANLLPQSVVVPTRPNKAAAFGALARTYLSMRDYANAGKYADSCLAIKNTLLDFNSLIPVGSIPIPKFNTETIFWNTENAPGVLSPNYAIVDSVLYNSYDPDDLRKTVFYLANSGTPTTYRFRGNYSGLASNFDPSPFDGLAVDEMYLIRAESFARAGNVSAAMNDLNTLMRKRWRNTSWVDFTAADATDALNRILIERRKELCFRGVRWSDIRRFNEEGKNITLKRIIDGITYSLPPNDSRWILLIPPQVINLSGIQQNPR